MTRSGPDTTSDVSRVAVEQAFRAESGRVLASLITSLGGDFDTAEEAMQDAFLAALEHWPQEGVPERPGAWITTTARRRAIDRIRRARRLVDKEAMLQALAEGDPGSALGVDPAVLVTDGPKPIADDRLRLIFTCCHPLLSPEARVALTLRTVAGIQTPAIARAFLVPDPTIAQRLVRAKKTIRTAHIPYQVPGPDDLPVRLGSVLLVLYLVFTEGYRQPMLAAGDDADARASLTVEATRLARLLTELLPNEAEAHGLLALMLLQDARRPARLDASGELVLLEDQDRSQWDQDAIAAGQQVLARAIRLGPAGPYQLQAAIALEHDLAPDAASTDWAAIIQLFRRLDELAPSPVVALNHAVAVSMIDGPEAALARVADWSADPRLRDYHLYHAVRADLLRRSGDRAAAAEAYRAAIARSLDPAERRYLGRRLAGLGLGSGPVAASEQVATGLRMIDAAVDSRRTRSS
ncbi:MAG: RNA polymerase sigma factor [Chloroflexi bacterium]|nr:RNA polymerase sigma factor [Chloroflexota bacterium]